MNSKYALFPVVLLAAFACSCGGRPRPPLDPSSPEGIARDSVDADLWDGLEDAKRELDAGRPVCAFARSEYMRSSYGDDKFNIAFEPIFRHKPGFDPSAKAERRLADRVARDPSSADAKMQLADIYISRSDWAKAEPLVRKAMDLRPDEVEYVGVLARIREAQKDEAGARSVMQTFATQHPTSNLAILIAAPKDHGKERLAALEAALDKKPDDAELLFDLAAEIQNSGDLAKAESTFRKAAQHGSDNAGIQAWTGRFLLKAQHDPKEALTFYLRAYFLNPHYYETEFVESRIGHLITSADLARCPR